MKVFAPTLLIFFLLAGCSSIPYDPNTSNAQVATDLKIVEQDINIISKCNFYPFQYGVKAYAQMRGCLFVESSRGAFIVGYDGDSKKYFSEFAFKITDINCAAIAKNEPGKGIVYLYTAKNAFTVALLHSNNDLNHEAVRKLERELSSSSIPILDLSISIADPLYKYKSSISSACPLKMR